MKILKYISRFGEGFAIVNAIDYVVVEIDRMWIVLLSIVIGLFLYYLHSKGRY